MQTDDQSPLEEVQFEDIDLLEADPMESTAEFRHRINSKLAFSRRIKRLGLLFTFFGIASMTWFILIPEILEYSGSKYFFHSASFFFLLCWGGIVAVIIGYFYAPTAEEQRVNQRYFQEAEHLTYMLIETHKKEQESETISKSDGKVG